MASCPGGEQPWIYKKSCLACERLISNISKGHSTLCMHGMTHACTAIESQANLGVQTSSPRVAHGIDCLRCLLGVCHSMCTWRARAPPPWALTTVFCFLGFRTHQMGVRGGCRGGGRSTVPEARSRAQTTAPAACRVPHTHNRPSAAALRSESPWSDHRMRCPRKPAATPSLPGETHSASFGAQREGGHPRHEGFITAQASRSSAGV